MSGIIDPATPYTLGLLWNVTVRVIDEATNKNVGASSYSSQSPTVRLTDAHRQQLLQIAKDAHDALLRVLDAAHADRHHVTK